MKMEIVLAKKIGDIFTKAKPKNRSQFRVASRNIGALYETVETVEV
jgi:hypothetical protein